MKCTTTGDIDGQRKSLTANLTVV